MPPKFVPKHLRGKVAAEKADKKEEKKEMTAAERAEAELKGEGFKEAVASNRTTTGILAVDKNARDIKVISFSLALHGLVLVEDTTFELSWGNRVGLVGSSGSGKSTLLQCIAAREIPLPKHLEIFLLSEEAPPLEISALEYVVESAKAEVARLEALAEQLLEEIGGEQSDILDSIHDKLDSMSPETFESRASEILHGLGFSEKNVPASRALKDMSGGWKMRAALAKALFVAPDLLLLDEPTNHLDLDACVWLANHLAEYKKMLLVISHSQDFLNDVCTHTMTLSRKKLRTWGGNYATFVKTKAEQDANQLKLYEKQQEEIAHIKSFIASCGTYANLVRQAQSRQKVLDKMIADGLIEKPYEEPRFKFAFPACGEMPPPLISVSDVSFSYSGKKADYLFSKINFGIASDSRICLVGPNGAGKSTLLKLLDKELSPTEGNISTKGGVTIARYTQHSDELLDYSLSPVEFMRKSFATKYPKYEEQTWRSCVGSWGLHSDYHYQPISILSAGLKQRLVFAYLAMLNPHVLLLDEPTNAADMQMIDSMAEAINKFEGAVICVSHDFALLSQIAREIWVVDHGVTIWKGDIRSYKDYLSRQVGGGSKGAGTGVSTPSAGAGSAKGGAGATAKAGAGKK